MRKKNSSDGVVISTGGLEISESLARIQRVVAPMGNRDVDIQYAAEVAEVILDRDYGARFRPNMGLSKFKREEQALVETPLVEVTYRYAPEVKEMPEIRDDLSIPLLQKNYPGKRLSDQIESLVAEETQTWLDVAFIQVATRAKLNQDGAIAEGMDVAKTFFGERSRVEKILKSYGEQNVWEEGEVAFLALMSACIIMLVITGMLMSDEDFFRNWWVKFGAMNLLVSSAMGYFRLNSPAPSSRRFVSEKYLAMKVPEEAARFVGLAYVIHDLMEKLGETVDAGKRAKLEEKLKKLLAEVEVLVVKNRRMLGERVKEGTPKGAKVAVVREEEFGGDENNSKIVVATKVRIAAAGVRVVEENGMESRGEAEIEAEAAEAEVEELLKERS